MPWGGKSQLGELAAKKPIAPPPAKPITPKRNPINATVKAAGNALIDKYYTLTGGHLLTKQMIGQGAYAFLTGYKSGPVEPEPSRGTIWCAIMGRKGF